MAMVFTTGYTGFHRVQSLTWGKFIKRTRPGNENLIPSQHRACSSVKMLVFAEHLRSYASLFAGEHKPVTTAIPNGKEYE
jgi:hypothetical protein